MLLFVLLFDAGVFVSLLLLLFVVAVCVAVCDLLLLLLLLFRDFSKVFNSDFLIWSSDLIVSGSFVDSIDSSLSFDRKNSHGESAYYIQGELGCNDINRE